MKSICDNIPAIVFWSVAIFVSLTYIGANGLWGAEDRWAEIVREMRLTGDYFHPCINGVPYFDKPLLGYWFIVLAAAITGQLNETTVRLPSAIAGLLALGATINIGRRLWSEKQARTAGWILLSTYGFLFWARTGQADMEDMAAIILAVAWYWARRDKPGFLSYLVFYLICFLGAQTKGLAAITVPVIVMLPDLLRQKRWKSYLSLSHVLALGLGLAVYLAPFVYSEMTRTGYQSSGLRMAFRENIVRYFRPFDHKEPFYIYFYHLPKLIFPWTPLILAAMWTAYTSFRKLDWPSKWLTIATIFIFLFFTVSGSRRAYYILPIIPFCALIASLYFTMQKEEKWNRWVLGIQMWVFVVIMATEILSPAVWPVIKVHIGFIAPKRLVFATALLGFIALEPLVLERVYPGLLARVIATEKQLTPSIVMAVIIVGGFFAWQHHLFDTYRSMKPFSRELKEKIDKLSSDNIAFYRKLPVKMLFYLDLPKPALQLNDTESLRGFLSLQSKTRVLVSNGQYQKELIDVLPDEMAMRPTMKEKVYPWEKMEKYKVWIIRSEAK
jgi:4-amino-4-deoxy-L-arabinose transferase-like glycosyltransferase